MNRGVAHALGVGLFLLAACRSAHGGTSATGPDEPPLSVQVVSVDAEPAVGFVRRAAIVEPHRRTVLGTKLLSRALSVPIELGTRVEAGQLLVAFDVRDLRARRAQVVASQGAATAAADLAEVELLRATSLDRSGAIAAANLDAARTSAVVRQADATGGAAMLRELDVQLGDGSLRAPFDGVVVQKRIEVGQLAAPGVPLVVLEDDRRLRVVTSIAEDDLPSLEVGRAYPIRVAGDARRPGTLDAIVSSGDPSAPGLVAVFLVDNPDGRLRPGVVAEVELPSTQATSSGFRLPASAVVRRGGLVGVYLVHEDRARLVWVSLEGEPRDGLVTVLEPLAPGESVIRDASLAGLRDRRRVEVAR